MAVRSDRQQKQELIEIDLQETTQDIEQSGVSGPYISDGLRFIEGTAGSSGIQSGDQSTSGYSGYEHLVQILVLVTYVKMERYHFMVQIHMLEVKPMPAMARVAFFTEDETKLNINVLMLCSSN